MAFQSYHDLEDSLIGIQDILVSEGESEKAKIVHPLETKLEFWIDCSEYKLGLSCAKLRASLNFSGFY